MSCEECDGFAAAADSLDLDLRDCLQEIEELKSRAEKAEAELANVRASLTVIEKDNAHLSRLYDMALKERDMWKMKCAENDMAPEILEQAEAELRRITTCPSCRTTHYACECGIKARFDLEAENKRLREALEFYADATIYQCGYDSDAVVDGGETARQALAETEEPCD